MSKIGWIFVSAVIFIMIWGTMLEIMPRHGVIVYNCSISEISPDYPIQVKEQCRKLRAENGRI
jgi:hypothetical protein